MQDRSATSIPTNMQNYSLTNMNGRWKLSFERSDVIFAGFDSTQEAVEFCSDMVSEPACLKIHRPDGTVIERNFAPGQGVPLQAA